MTLSSLYSLTLKKPLTVFQPILLAKLQAYGIQGDYIKWFRSYLTDRTQYVNFNGEASAEHTLKCGVPQGSLLGPLFVIIFVNDDV